MINDRGLNISSRTGVQGQRGRNRSEAEKEGRARGRSPVSSFDDCGTGKLQAQRKCHWKGPTSLKAHLSNTLSPAVYVCTDSTTHLRPRVQLCEPVGDIRIQTTSRTLPLYTYESLQGISDLQHIVEMFHSHDYCWTSHKNGEMEAAYNPINRWKDNEMWHFMEL